MNFLLSLLSLQERWNQGLDIEVELSFSIISILIDVRSNGSCKYANHSWLLILATIKTSTWNPKQLLELLAVWKIIISPYNFSDTIIGMRKAIMLDSTAFSFQCYLWSITIALIRGMTIPVGPKQVRSNWIHSPGALCAVDALDITNFLGDEQPNCQNRTSQRLRPRKINTDKAQATSNH